ncbi:MAG TPA: NAD+ synthase [Cellvibrionaceae bacterium]
MSMFTAAMAQINPCVGDITGNCSKIIEICRGVADEGSVDWVIFPELTLTGYPPEDLLLRPALKGRIAAALARLCTYLPADVAVVIGYPKVTDQGVFNAAGIIYQGQIQLEYFKQCLPNYQVFDEKRYFIPGCSMPVWHHKGVCIALTICEDIWHAAPAQQAQAAGAQVLINLNASPFHRGKSHSRENIVTKRCQETGLAIVYVNQVGGQDELVFDGGSFAMNAHGQIIARATSFNEQTLVVNFNGANSIAPHLEDLASVYSALVLGVRDYVGKNCFKGAVLGLSGGIDSALTLAIAADAIGPEHVDAVMMPFRYTSDMSQTDAALQANLMGVNYQSISIESIFGAFETALKNAFHNAPVDKTEENLQARSRGVILMALSNKTGSLVLTTDNKSEMSVGYATLYGDMAGGLDVLKDVPKTLVFELARYRNSISPVIPERVITRPPSAELAPGQKDEDSLPPYEVLDQILALYIEEDASAADIVAHGFDADIVKRVLRMVDLNEYKRRQAAIGIRISQRGFGRDRRYPITNGWALDE